MATLSSAVWIERRESRIFYLWFKLLPIANKPRPLLSSRSALPLATVADMQIYYILLHMSINVNVNMKRFDLFRKKIVRKDNLKVAERHFICKYIAFIMSWIIYGGSICCCQTNRAYCTFSVRCAYRLLVEERHHRQISMTSKGLSERNVRLFFNVTFFIENARLNKRKRAN